MGAPRASTRAAASLPLPVHTLQGGKPAGVLELAGGRVLVASAAANGAAARGGVEALRFVVEAGGKVCVC